jgi:uncharacterized protein
MEIFLLSFGIVTLLVLLMAIGVLFGRKPIAGSCGGYKALNAECAIGCKHPCEQRKVRMKTAAEASTKAHEGEQSP